MSTQIYTALKKKPIDGGRMEIAGRDGTVAFSVTFKGKKVTIERLGEPEVVRMIGTFGNRRVIDAQLYDVADKIREFLFDLKDDTP